MSSSTDQPAPHEAARGLRLGVLQEQRMREWPKERIRPKSVALGVLSLLADVDALREQLAERTRELEQARRREQVFHALVCNAFGYDKSIVRALAIWARHNGDAWAKHLAERVIAAEEAARVALPCSEAHPVLAARAAEGDGEVTG
jgi:hypothetical protein